MPRKSLLAVLCSLLLPGLMAAEGPPQPVPPANMPALKRQADIPQTVRGLPLRFECDFEKGADQFQPTDADAWRVVEQDGNRVYALTVRQSNYKPPQRSPYNISLINGVDAGTVAIDVQFQSAMTDYGHRSLCLFFNYVDPSHFYYVHFGKKADPHANQIFIVNAADRKAISETTTEGTPWDDEWHHARVIRDADSGRIEVFFDDMTKPIMTATDKTFTSGKVGIGSFDDAGNFDRVAVFAAPAE